MHGDRSGCFIVVGPCRLHSLLVVLKYAPVRNDSDRSIHLEDSSLNRAYTPVLSGLAMGDLGRAQASPKFAIST